MVKTIVQHYSPSLSSQLTILNHSPPSCQPCSHHPHGELSTRILCFGPWMWMRWIAQSPGTRWCRGESLMVNDFRNGKLVVDGWWINGSCWLMKYLHACMHTCTNPTYSVGTHTHTHQLGFCDYGGWSMKDNEAAIILGGKTLLWLQLHSWFSEKKNNHFAIMVHLSYQPSLHTAIQTSVLSYLLFIYPLSLHITASLGWYVT